MLKRIFINLNSKELSRANKYAPELGTSPKTTNNNFTLPPEREAPSPFTSSSLLQSNTQTNQQNTMPTSPYKESSFSLPSLSREKDTTQREITYPQETPSFVYVNNR